MIRFQSPARNVGRTGEPPDRGLPDISHVAVHQLSTGFQGSSPRQRASPLLWKESQETSQLIQFIGSNIYPCARRRCGENAQQPEVFMQNYLSVELFSASLSSRFELVLGGMDAYDAFGPRLGLRPNACRSSGLSFSPVSAMIRSIWSWFSDDDRVRTSATRRIDRAIIPTICIVSTRRKWRASPRVRESSQLASLLMCRLSWRSPLSS